MGMDPDLCPICGEVLASDLDIEDGQVVAATEHCDSGCGLFTSEYQTGSTRVTVGDQVWVWSYMDSSMDINNFRNQIQEAINAQILRMHHE